MDLLVTIAMHNVIIVTILALLVWGVTRVWKNPPIAHILWLLLLVKLVTPPVVNLELWSRGPVVTRPQLAQDASVSSLRDQSGASRLPINVPSDTAGNAPQANWTADVVQDIRSSGDVGTVYQSFTTSNAWTVVYPLLIGVWFCGIVIVALMASRWIVQFHRLLAGALPASEPLQSTLKELASRMGLRNCPDLCVVDCSVAPLVWSVGRRAKIVLPKSLLNKLDEDQIAMVLAHELAHLRRCDHWVRILELIVSVVYWWNPLVWWIRRELHAVEEQCCDAWVTWVYPDRIRKYAESLLTAVEFLTTPSNTPELASPFLNAQTLKERIVVILKGRSPRRASGNAVVWLALLSMMVIPTGVLTVGSKDRIVMGGENDEPPPTDKEQDGAVSTNEVATNLELIPIQPAAKVENAMPEERRAEIDAAIARLKDRGAFVREFHPRDDPRYWVQIISTGVGANTRQSAENFDDEAMKDVETVARGVTLHLHLRQTSVTSSGLERLASIGKIEMLELTGANITYGILKVLPKLPLQGHLGLQSDMLRNVEIKPVTECQQLTGISLDGIHLGNASLEYLTQLPKLQSVSLGKHFTREAFETLSRLESLTNLDVSHLNPELSDLKLVPNLKTLSLSGKAYNDESALTIAETFKSLQEAYLRDTSITDIGVEYLSRLEKLTVLTLDRSLVTDKMADSIRKMKQLKWLSVENCEIGDDTLAAVSECPDLWYLFLGGTPVTDKGIAHVVNFQKPVNIYLPYCKSVTDASIDSLARLPNSENQHLALWGSGITENGFNRLKTALPNAQIRWAIR